MTTAIKFIFIMSNMMMLFTLNPVKMSMLLMIMSSTTFFMISEMSGSTWFPILFYMLFTGGVLIMFMILSSIMPNEKSMKLKMKLMTMMVVSAMVIMNSNMSNMTNIKMKWSFQSSSNLQMLMMLMLIYFMIFIKMISKESIPLRSYTC